MRSGVQTVKIIRDQQIWKNPKFRALDVRKTGQKVVMLGDSLTAGYGLAKADALPAQLQEMLAQWLPTIEIVNQGISGDTTAGGVNRLSLVIDEQPDLVVIQLGANDALRQVPVKDIKENLEKIITSLRADGVKKILLVGIEFPVSSSRNREYIKQFNGLYAYLAGKYKLSLYPNILYGVAQNPELNLPDGVHPNARGVRRIAQSLTPYIYNPLR